jgi:hypothetical protein
LGHYYLRGETLVVKLTNGDVGSSWNWPAVADAVRIQKIEGDRGLDDDFHLQGTSPGVDRGSPYDYYLRELAPNGGRINVGRYGNTPEATTSAEQLVQVLSPNGLEKYEEGQEVTIQWRSSGLTEDHPVALVNAGGGGRVDNWLSDKYQTVSHQSSSFSNAVDRSLVVDPAPEQVYQSYAYAQSASRSTPTVANCSTHCSRIASSRSRIFGSSASSQ